MIRLHRLCVLLCAATFGQLLAGALVTSTGSGLSIPAWPAIAAGDAPGAALQQAHRLLAATVGILAIGVVAAAWRYDPRPWMKGLAAAAAALLLAQAVYGGIAVVMLLPGYFSIFHAAFAQLFFALTVAMALFTSRGWRAGNGGEALRDDRGLRRVALASVLVIYGQVLVGAAMRHSYTIDGRPAGLAIPDFPLAFGRVLPVSELASVPVGLAFAHRVLALAAAALVTITFVWVYRRYRADTSLVRPALLLALLLLAQVALGGLTVLSGITPLVAAAHALVVAVALGAGLVLLLRASGPLLGAGDDPAAGQVTAA